MCKKRAGGSITLFDGQKKAQVTVFIIIGLLILISIGAVYSYRNSQAKSLVEVPEITESIPSQMQPVKLQVEQCLNTIATDAVVLIGMHGGYIGTDTTSFDYTSKSFDIAEIADIQPTETDVVLFGPVERGWTIPYWYHMTSDNDCQKDCQFEKLIPALTRTEETSQTGNSAEIQIEEYISEHFASCINGFKNLNDQGFTVKEIGPFVPRVNVAEKNIFVFATYPLEVGVEGITSEVSQYRTTLDLNLNKIRDLAEEIVNLESGNSAFLEQTALNIIEAFSDVDKNALPPMAATDISFVSIFWPMNEVQERLQNYLEVYAQLLTVTNTANFNLNPEPEDILATTLYNSFVVPVNGVYPRYEVKFNYDSRWPIYLYLNKDDPFRSKSGSTFAITGLIFPMQTYNAPYDLSFPISVEIRDTKALVGKGYSFFFALESNLRNNEPFTSDTELFEAPKTPPSPKICDENKRTSGEVSFEVVDQEGNPIPEAIVVFNTGQSSCPIGITSLDSSGRAVFSSKFPKGAIESIVVSKSGEDIYTPYTIPFFSADDTPKDLGTIVLKPYVIKNAKIHKVEIVKSLTGLNAGSSSWRILAQQPLDLLANERAVILFERIKEDPNEPDFVTALEFDKDHKEVELRMLPGKYKITHVLIQDPVTIIIPESTISGGMFSSDKTIPEVVLADANDPDSSSFITSYVIEEHTFTDVLYDTSKGIEFTAVLFNPQDITRLEDLEEWSNTQRYADSAMGRLRPILYNIE